MTVMSAGLCNDRSEQLVAMDCTPAGFTVCGRGAFTSLVCVSQQ